MSELVRAIMREIQRAVVQARAAGVVCEYPPYVDVDGIRYPFEVQDA